MKTRLYGLLNIGWTLFHFLRWGGYYSTWIGLVVGTAIFPLLGTAMGSFIGIGVGLGVGLLVGVGVAIFHSLFFDPDTNLELYRRRLAKGVGGFALILGLLSLLFLLNSTTSSHYWSFPQWLFLLGVSSGCLVWVGLSSAYTAHYYPDQLIKRLIGQDQLSLENSNTTLESHIAAEQMEEFLRRIYPRWMYVITGFIGIGIGAAGGFMGLAAGSLVAILATFVLAFYCAVGNAFLLSFLKTVVFEALFPDVSPHRYRTALTLIAFLYTLITTWWTLIFAPLVAFYIAYHVYHTLALPDEGFEKAKRKEKTNYASVGQAV